jgi:hypothetical protein
MYSFIKDWPWLHTDTIKNSFADAMWHTCWSQRPRSLRRRSAAARLLRSWVRIAPGAWIFVVSAVCCQVKVSATSWSLVQRSPTDCGASLCVIYKPQEWEGHDPRWVAEPQKEDVTHVHKNPHNQLHVSALFKRKHGADFGLVSKCCISPLITGVYMSTVNQYRLAHSTNSNDIKWTRTHSLRAETKVSSACYTIQLMYYSHFKTHSLKHLKPIKS